MRTCVDRVDNELRFKDIDSSSVKMETFFLNDEESRYDNGVYVKIDGIRAKRCVFNASDYYYNAFCISSGILCFIKDDTPVQRVNVKLVNDD